MSCENEIITVVIQSPIGELKVESCERGIHRLEFPSANLSENKFKPNLAADVSLNNPSKCNIPEPIYLLQDWLQKYFNRQDTSSVPVCFLLNDDRSFSKRCLKTLQSVPVGKTVSYGALAALMGEEKTAARAVGTVMRKNPVPILIPCHRVVKSDGSLGNYSGGTLNFLKAWLLNFEKDG